MSSLRYRRPPTESIYRRTPSYATIPKDINVIFYNNGYQRSKILYLNKYNALEKVIEAAHEMFPSNRVYRLFSDYAIGARNELRDSFQVMDSIQNLDHILPQLIIRLEETSIRSNDFNGHYEVIPIMRPPSQVSHRHSVRFNDPPYNYINNYAEFYIQCRNCFHEITGTRYHCLVCPDYDICGNCEKDMIHSEHALIRIVSPRVTRIPGYVTANAPRHVFPEDRYYVERAV